MPARIASDGLRRASHVYWAPGNSGARDDAIYVGCGLDGRSARPIRDQESTPTAIKTDATNALLDDGEWARSLLRPRESTSGHTRDDDVGLIDFARRDERESNLHRFALAPRRDSRRRRDRNFGTSSRYFANEPTLCGHRGADLYWRESNEASGQTARVALGGKRSRA